MGAFRLYVLVSAVGLAAAAAIAFVAAFDHSHPEPTPQHEWVSAWYCTNLHERCADEKPWHQRWHEREPLYNLSFAGTLTAGALFGLAALSRRRNTVARSYNRGDVRRGGDLA